MIQTFLTVKWVQMRLNNELSPEKIVTFFVQWIDPTRTYDFDEVELKVTYTVRPMCRGCIEGFPTFPHFTLGTKIMKSKKILKFSLPSHPQFTSKRPRPLDLTDLFF